MNITVKQIIQQKLQNNLQPVFLQIIDESHLHKHHKEMLLSNKETHFRITIKAQALSKLSKLEAHRAINAILAEELSTKIHALAIKIIK